VFYPKREARVSSFHPLIDNLRISLMHTRLLGRRLLPLVYPRVVPIEKKYIPLDMLKHPIGLLKTLLRDDVTPLGLGVSAGIGIFLGTLPLVSAHALVIIYVTSRLHINKIMALAIQNLCMPPFVPLACIELGHFMRYGKWLTGISWKIVFGAIPERLWEWFLGSLIIAPVLALIIGLAVYLAARRMQKKTTLYAK
jgi:uncharacterized protein (DUF2062 family)